MQVSKETQHHDPSVARTRLKFPTVEQRRKRIAETFANGQYDHPTDRYVKPTDTLATQTEIMGEREIAVGGGEAVYEAPERVQELELRLPNPQDFPILTIAQLIEAEQRTLQLIRLLEGHLVEATTEENESRRIERLKKGIEEGKRSSMLISTQEYHERMGERVKQRLRKSYQDHDGEKLPSQWAEEKIKMMPTSPSPLRQRNGRGSQSPLRGGSVAAAGMGAFDFGSPYSATSGGQQPGSGSPVQLPSVMLSGSIHGSPQSTGGNGIAPPEDDDEAPPPPPPEDDEEGPDASASPLHKENISPSRKGQGVEKIDVDHFVSSVQPGVPSIAPKKKARAPTKWDNFTLFSGKK